MILDRPRSLNQDEERVLRTLLAPEFPGADELRAQIPDVRVVATCDCGCPTIDLTVPASLPQASTTTRDGRIPYEGDVKGPDGVSIADIMVFVEEGRLSSLEYVTHQEPAPNDWPQAYEIALVGPLD